MQFEVVLLQEAQAFLRGLDAKLQAKAYRAIDLLGIFGPRLTMPHARKLSDFDLWELRAMQGNMICRLFYFYDKATHLRGHIRIHQEAAEGQQARNSQSACLEGCSFEGG